jgi:hypothetical protein
MDSPTTVDTNSSAPPGVSRDGSARSDFSLRRGLPRGLQPGSIAGWLAEAGRPLALVSAQLLYMGVPFFGRGAERLARLLEADDDGAGLRRWLSDEANERSTESEGIH